MHSAYCHLLTISPTSIFPKFGAGGLLIQSPSLLISDAYVGALGKLDPTLVQALSPLFQNAYKMKPHPGILA